MRKIPDYFVPRSYRARQKPEDLVNFNVMVGETDLWVSAERDLTDQTFPLVKELRKDIEEYIKQEPLFLTSLTPLPVPEAAPAIIKTMAQAATRAGVGPMAAVAGAIAEAVGRRLSAFSRQVIVENGGDIFLKSTAARTMEVLVTEQSPFSKKIFIKIPPAPEGTGLCTSSGVIGHSLSFGKSEAVMVKSLSAALADAAATAVGNVITDETAVDAGIALAQKIPGVTGVLIIIGRRIGLWGEVELRA